MIRGDKTIPAYYSGLVSTLGWLTGKTDKLDLDAMGEDDEKFHFMG
jgi:hypothetical protein